MFNATATGDDAGHQMKNIMHRLLDDPAFVPESIIFSTILLRSMDDFAAINATYRTFFTAPNPPARVTISCGEALPPGILVLVSVTATNASLPKTAGLHVQSRSYWAPANIGPYSQAITVPMHPSLPADEQRSVRLTCVAGQIPLIPATMELCSSEGNEQTVLSLQHLWRIGQVMDVDLWLGAVAFLSVSDNKPTHTRASIALDAWRLAHEPPEETLSDDEEDIVDVWDLKHGQYTGHSDQVGTTRRKEIQTDFVPPCFVVEVQALPRDADIEWSSLGVNSDGAQYGLQSMYTSITRMPSLVTAISQAYPHSSHAMDPPNADIELDLANATTTDPSHLTIWTKASLNNDATVIAGWLCFESFAQLELFDPETLSERASYTYTIYASAYLSPQHITGLNAQVIPCYSIWGSAAEPLVALIAYRLA